MVCAIDATYAYFPYALSGGDKMEKVVAYEKAKKLIAESTPTLSHEVVTLEKALNRVTAEEVHSPTDIPETATSAMDGYALRVQDIQKVPARLKIVAEVLAGEKKRISLSPGESCYVATGAALPDNADTVIKVEDAKVEGDWLVVDRKPEKGQFVNPQGSELQKGKVVVPKGEKIDFRIAGLLARVGAYQVKVFLKPKIAVIATGKEIKEPFEEGGIKNTNAYILKGLLKEYADISYMGIIDDSLPSIKEAIKEASKHHHIVITTGGVSVGKADFVKKALSELGWQIRFEFTNIKPGRPLTFATLSDTLFFGLPGYPSAMLVNALEFLMPAVRKLQGFSRVDNSYIEVIAAENFKSRKGKVYFVRANFEFRDGKVFAYSAGSQLTSNYFTSAVCQGFVIIPEEKESLAKGEVAKALML